MEITEQDYSSLVDAQIIVDVLLGSTDITLKKFLSLNEGDIIALDKVAGAGGDIYVNSRIVGTGDIIVIDEKLAARIQDAMDSDNVVGYFFNEQVI
ncbi:MAG TPA: flagellar motor switch protein FliN [Arcobacter sp.]|jgi:flagellar motor switch protein FliN/FliY|nr:flagellar motor switch protein FliN [Arcobacter sp.]